MGTLLFTEGRGMSNTTRDFSLMAATGVRAAGRWTYGPFFLQYVEMGYGEVTWMVGLFGFGYSTSWAISWMRR